MAKKNSINLDATANADGFDLGGGTTARTLTLTGGNVTIAGSGSAVITFPSTTSTLSTLALSETFTNKTLTSPVLNTPTVGTSILPTATDTAALGSATVMWSDLFLASGAVINFNNGDVTLTHSADALTFGGVTVVMGELQITNGNAIRTGQTAGNTMLFNAFDVDGTSYTTFLTLTANNTPTLTLSGALTLAENASIALDPAGSADGKYSGITIAGTAGATLAFGQLCYLAVADSRWELADADAAATMGTPLLGMCVLAAAADGSATTMLLYGTIRADAQFPALTIGATVYGGETAGAIQVAIPTGADNIIRVVGHALTADEILFNPSQDHQVTVA